MLRERLPVCIPEEEKSVALTCCINPECDRCYLEKYEKCPYCGTHNFFCDDDMTLPAVHVLIAQLHEKRRIEKKEKLRELRKFMPPPWWKRLLDWLFESI